MQIFYYILTNKNSVDFVFNDFFFFFFFSLIIPWNTFDFDNEYVLDSERNG